MCDVSAVYIDPKHFQTRDMCGNHHYVMDMCHNHHEIRDMCHNHYGISKPVYFIDPSNFSNHNQHEEDMKAFEGLSQSYRNSLLNYPCDININYEFETEYIGPTGPTGPAGPAGSTEVSTKKVDILSVYTNRQQEIATNGFVEFDFNGAMYGNCYHEPGKSELWVWTPGCYCVYYSLYTAEPCQFSLSKNDSLVIPGSTIGSVIGSSQNTHMFVVQITGDDMTTETGLETPKMACKLQLINNTTSTSSITLIDATGSNNILPQVSASMNMYLLQSI